jgi:triosephosphate isomerase (TIM)
MKQTAKTIHLFANWKMYLDYDESNILANAIASSLKKRPSEIRIAVFPSALALYPAGQVLRDVGIGVGAQNVFWADKGGYTGEVSAQMYKDAGCEYALVGHSERRHVFGETNHDVRQKLESVINLGLTPVVCVGETAEERKAGKTDETVEVQLRAAFQNLAIADEADIFVAYEPVWAIGTGDACGAEEAGRVHKIIKNVVAKLSPKLNCKILYGGSVRADNVVEYLSLDNTDGVLIGNASAKVESFKDIFDQAVKLLND